MISLSLVALLAAGAAAFTALPLLRGHAETPQQAPARSWSARLELLEQRDRALAALKELELELRSKALSQADHDALAAPLREEALAALAALEAER